MNSRLSKKLVSLLVACVLFSPAVFGKTTVLAAAKTPEYIGTKNTAKKAADSKKPVNTTPVILTLEDIQVIKTAAHLSGDEIYVNITEYSSVDKPAMHRIPEYPSHWLSKYIDKVKDVTLWQKPIQDEESVELIISVVESDAPPWDVDDLIGSVKLKVYIEKGKLEQEWSIPNKAIVKSEGEKGHFVLTGDGAEYKISLKLKLDKHTEADKNKDKEKDKDKKHNKKA